MKLKSFDYTKADGTTSHREFIEFYGPTHLCFGVDVTELEEADRIDLATKLAYARSEFDKDVATLMELYDVKHNFRQFKPESMTNVESENFSE